MVISTTYLTQQKKNRKRRARKTASFSAWLNALLLKERKNTTIIYIRHLRTKKKATQIYDPNIREVKNMSYRQIFNKQQINNTKVMLRKLFEKKNHFKWTDNLTALRELKKKVKKKNPFQQMSLMSFFFHFNF